MTCVQLNGTSAPTCVTCVTVPPPNGLQVPTCAEAGGGSALLQVLILVAMVGVLVSILLRKVGSYGKRTQTISQRHTS
jgi:hypothetical protein